MPIDPVYSDSKRTVVPMTQTVCALLGTEGGGGRLNSIENALEWFASV